MEVIEWMVSVVVRTVQDGRCVVAGLILSGAVCMGYMLVGKWQQVDVALQQLVRVSHAPRPTLIVAGVIFFSACLPSLLTDHILSLYPFESTTWHWVPLVLGGALVGTGTTLNPKPLLCNPLHFLLIYLAATLTLTYNLHTYLPTYTANKTTHGQQQLIMAAALLVPFVQFILGPKKYLKVLIQQILYFCVGIAIASAHMLLDLSKPSVFASQFTVSTRLTMPYLTAVIIASAASKLFFYLMNRYKNVPLFAIKTNPENHNLTIRSVAGSLCIGLGWAVGKMSLSTFLILLPHTSAYVIALWAVPYLAATKITSIVFK